MRRLRMMLSLILIGSAMTVSAAQASGERPLVARADLALLVCLISSINTGG